MPLGKEYLLNSEKDVVHVTRYLYADIIVNNIHIYKNEKAG